MFNKDFFDEYFDKSSIPQSPNPKSLAEALYRSSVKGGLEDLLRLADRNSMAHSREVRLPFLSHKLVEFLFTLPPHLKIKDGVTKYIMRQSFAGLVPVGIMQRQDKIGYEPPQKKWLESQLMKERIQLADNFLTESKILDTNFMANSSNRNDSQFIWKNLMAHLVHS